MCVCVCFFVNFLFILCVSVSFNSMWSSVVSSLRFVHFIVVIYFTYKHSYLIFMHIFSVAVVVAFFFCWAPFHAQRLVAFYGQNQLYAIATYVSGVLYYLSTCINPLLYNIMSNKFREAFKVRQKLLTSKNKIKLIKTACALYSLLYLLCLWSLFWTSFCFTQTKCHKWSINVKFLFFIHAQFSFHEKINLKLSIKYQ